MTGFTPSSLLKEQQNPSVRQQFLTTIKSFWAFSNFYGEYQALAPAQRRRHLARLEAEARGTKQQ